MDFLAKLEKKLQDKASGTTQADFYTVDGIDLRVRAPNAIAWIAGPQYLNRPEIYWHRRQYQVVRDLFQLRCPICNTGSGDCWDKTQEQLKAEVLLCYDAGIDEDRCPRCRCTRSELEDDGLLKRYDTMIGIAGMRSGKSVVAGFIGSYERHVFVSIALVKGRNSLHQYFGVLPTQALELAFVATTNTQSNQTIWANFFNQCKDSPWFKAYTTWVKAREGEQLKLPGVKGWRYNENESEIEDGWCFFNCVSLHSNSGSLAGRTRLGFMVDELARFNTGESKVSADEVWAVFDHSLKTVRGARMGNRKIPAWMGSAIAITSPISIEDKSMQLYNKGKTIAEWFVWKYPTWLFNPAQPRANFDSDYALDPVKAERDFGANPPNAASPLVEQPLLYLDAVDKTALPSARFESYTHTDPIGNKYVAARLEFAELDSTRPLYIFGDAGMTFDQFAMTACSFAWLPSLDRKDRADFERERITRHLDAINNVRKPPPVDEESMTLVTYHEWSIRMIPSNNQRVWFESAVDIIRAVSKQRKIAMVAFDHWNSQSTLQQISQMAIPTQIVRLTPEDFSRLVQDSYTGRARLLPWAEDDGMSMDSNGTLTLTKEGENLSPEGCCIYEMLRLERSPDLRRIYNPEKGKVRGRNSDDLASTMVGAHRLVQESLGLTRPDRRIEKQAREVAAAATFRGGVVHHKWGLPRNSLS